VHAEKEDDCHKTKQVDRVMLTQVENPERGGVCLRRKIRIHICKC
jgi:hypothetical protein